MERLDARRHSSFTRFASFELTVGDATLALHPDEIVALISAVVARARQPDRSTPDIT